MLKPTLLLYNVDAPTLNTVTDICAGLELELRVVEPREYAQTLAALIGLPGGKTAPAPALRMPFSEPMLVMVNLTHPQFDALLAAGIPGSCTMSWRGSTRKCESGHSARPLHEVFVAFSIIN